MVALARQGGKANHMAAWVNSLLPLTREYVEPFAGMLGVLLNRPRSAIEIANDRDDLLINWWEYVQSLRLRRRLRTALELVPRSRSRWRDARRIVDAPSGRSGIELAVAMHVCIGQSFAGRGQTWAVPSLNAPIAWSAERWDRLAARVADVAFEARDAVAVLRSVSARGEAAIYVDPPYEGTDTTGFRTNVVDRQAMREALLACAGKVALSGFGSEWDCLGWRKTCKQRRMGNTVRSARTEVLWTNYEPELNLF